MRLLIYDPWNLEHGLAADLCALIARSGWSADWLAATRRLCAAERDSHDYREWLLLHERELSTGRWRKFTQQPFDAFIGFGSASAVLAAALPRSVRKFAVVEQLESKRFVRLNAESRSVFHRRVEIDLLRTFDQVVASSNIASLFADEGLKNVVTSIQEIENVLTVRKVA